MWQVARQDTIAAVIKASQQNLAGKTAINAIRARWQWKYKTDKELIASRKTPVYCLSKTSKKNRLASKRGKLLHTEGTKIVVQTWETSSREVWT